jgi:hypothetical protein
MLKEFDPRLLWQDDWATNESLEVDSEEITDRERDEPSLAPLSSSL